MIRENYFCVHHKNRGKHNQRFELLFFQLKFTLWHIKLNMYISKIEFSSHKQYLFGRLYCRNGKKTQTKVRHKFFCFVQIETTHKPSKVAAGKNSFFSVYVIDKTCFDECFLFHVITRGHYFL